MEVMEVDGNLDLFNCKNSPLDQDLILKLVLKHVGKTDIDDLLACRLVNHSWNRAVVYELEQHGYAVEMDYKKMVKFRSLLWKSRMSRTQFTNTKPGGELRPLTDHHRLVSLRLSLIIEVAENSSEHANEMGEAAQLLMFYPQLRVAFIKCSYNESFTGSAALLTNHELFNVLNLTSSTLTNIRISVEDFDELKSPSFEEFDFNESFETVEFPKLTSLRYELIYCDTHNNEMVDTTRHVLSIIKNSPNLIKLDLKICEASGDKSANCFQKLIEPCATNLEQLTLRGGYEDNEDLILNAISESGLKFRKLTRLKLNTFNFIICENTQKFTQHLKTKYPALTNFQINSIWISDEPEELAELQLEFPIFNNITEFGFYTNFVRIALPEHLESVRAIFNKMMSFYPGLLVMRLGLGVLLMLEAHLRESGQLIPQRNQYQVFPSVLTLEVKISDPWFKLITGNDNSGSKIYHHIFPNIQQLVIKLPAKSFRTSPDKEQMTQAIAFLCYHPEIRAIEIHNYAQPWFEQMKEDDLSLINWEGVKSLKIFPPKTGDDDECPRPQLNLPSIVAQFPKLEFLQYGKAKIYETQIETIRYSFNIMKNPISKFRKNVSSSSTNP